ncbi:hypothetical protein PFICI_08185 [Pestalotiopsis fici W106-1]|uniref:FAD-binding PCMH-type domain-containing protein n=1 Tax=Pestalotiopsis fici (strain W106-1 / CGMCC3.15140) TaxID=1229662 RepID=W3X658_PESFW|nr:uncharacterized protein PFICI_08185 [Pestalotiopsis fici W106-1]ETS80656.1 hypothetical protein PFICI_08185 [Pestalotiopsis fici W106-1]
MFSLQASSLLAGAFLGVAAAASNCSNTSTPYSALPRCKVTPSDPDWPSITDWQSLNSSIDGALISTIPIASSCYAGNPFGASDSCDDVSFGWGYSYFHSDQPESIDYPIWANNSCLPPNATGYDPAAGCHIGGYPSYVVNATTAEQVATALKWASDRNVRVVVKGTGHDLNGRSTGAFSLSIWTRHFNGLEINNSWLVPGANETAQVLVTGSGNNWGEALLYSLNYDRIVTSGVDRTVGLGGYIQGGGHGPLSSTYGLAADQLLQVTVATVAGNILVCNSVQNQDLFWAVRGGGGGQYGVVTEYVILTYPTPANIAASSVSIMAANMSDYSDATVNATWIALSQLMSSFPDIMDQGIAGSGAAFTGLSGNSILGLSEPIPGVLASFNFWALNMTTEAMDDLLSTVEYDILSAVGDSRLISLTFSNSSSSSNYTEFFLSMNSSPSSAGQVSLTASRLIGRGQLGDLAVSDVASYFQRAMASQSGNGSMLTVGLQGGPGPRNVPENRRGAVNPVWRDVYLHILHGGANVDTDANTPRMALQAAAEWLDVNKEAVFREWAPETGAYMNEANPFNTEWKHDFYGSSYDRLVQIKREFDPTYTLFVWSGVDSEFWDYDMDSGKLCQI